MEVCYVGVGPEEDGWLWVTTAGGGWLHRSFVCPVQTPTVSGAKAAAHAGTAPAFANGAASESSGGRAASPGEAHAAAADRGRAIKEEIRTSEAQCDSLRASLELGRAQDAKTDVNLHGESSTRHGAVCQ